MRPKFQLVATIACGAAFANAAFAGTPAQPSYRVTVLTSKGGAANSVDDNTVVAGSYTTTTGAVHASLWAFGAQVDLGTLGSGSGLNSLVQWPVKNVLGLVSGISLTDALDPNKEGWSCSAFLDNPNFNVCQGFRWNPLSHQMRALPTLGGTNGFATGTNDLGETAGWAETKAHDSSCVPPQVLQFLPVVWGPGGSPQALPLIGKDTSGAATALNDRGQVVGISGACGIAVGGVSALHAVLWENGVAHEIVNPNHAPYWNTPMMINQQGEVVGFAGVPNDPNGKYTQPFEWNVRAGWQAIPLLNGDISGVAASVNAHGQIVGYSNDANSNYHPWILVNGVPVNLNALVSADSDLTDPLLLAFDVNDLGEIAGLTAGFQAFIATPVR